jgi:hypothetical protein
MTDKSGTETENIMTEAHELLRGRLTARGLEAVHLVFAVTPDGHRPDKRRARGLREVG